MGSGTHDAFGWWLKDAWESNGAPEVSERLSGTKKFSYVIVGGGFTGMWAALSLARRVPPDSICIVESEICGTGPSGRNGGFADSLVHAMPRVIKESGSAPAARLLKASEDAVADIGRWAAEAGEDIWFRPVGQMIVNCGRGLEAVEACRAISRPDALVPLSKDEVNQRCFSPVFENGAIVPGAATVNPGRLSMALRRELLKLGVRLFEQTRVTALSSNSSGVQVRTADGLVQAAQGILAAGAGSTSFRGLKRELTLTSSHIVMTEPVPELIESLGWGDGVAVTDARHLVHYFRPTPDGRVLFGWGGGRIASGVRPSSRDSIDAGVVAQVRKDLVRFFPGLGGVEIAHSWGGPVDASPRHLPGLRAFAPGWHAAFGYTGNGVGPSRLCGDALADLSLGEFGPDHGAAPLLLSTPKRLPPEPFRRWGGELIRRGIDSQERAGERGASAGALARGLAGIPDRLGYRIGR
ncbi:MAG: FAD-dependent oxidoreductase [Solirubrobacterales bacterium]|nr:FAD-dependent oxidoreductase [Solirubrobacterales bacterium]